MKKRGNSFSILFLLASILFAGTGSAASITVTWDFATGGSAHTNVGSTYGNVRTFTEDGVTVTANAWADTGPTPPPNALEAAHLGRYSTGLGVCNSGEGSVSYCTGNNPLHQVDNVSQEDLVLFQFDQPMIFHEIVIDPYGEWDRDVSFWIGNTANPLDLTGVGIADLGTVGFGAQMDDYNGISSAPLTIMLDDLQGNSLLFGALFPPNAQKDRFKIRSLTATVVPLPPAAWLLGSGLMVLFGARRKRK